jgi:hypothetical protein
MPSIGVTSGSFCSGLRTVGQSPILSCSIGGGSSPIAPPIVTQRNIVVTGIAFGGGLVWGSNPYTEDSDMNVAAVHAGLVSVGEVATITQYAPGEYSSTPGYVGSTRNGVTTLSFSSEWCGLYLRRD